MYGGGWSMGVFMKGVIGKFRLKGKVELSCVYFNFFFWRWIFRDSVLVWFLGVGLVWRGDGVVDLELKINI